MKYKKLIWRYELLEDYTFFGPMPWRSVFNGSLEINAKYLIVTREGNLIVVKGYAWNGANKPGINSAGTKKATLLHDAIYQLMRDGYLSKKYKKAADKAMQRQLVNDGIHPFRAWLWYQAVKWFGHSSLDRGKYEREVEKRRRKA